VRRRRGEGWVGSCRLHRRQLGKKGCPGSKIIFVGGNVWGATSTDGAFFAQFPERLGFGFRDLKLFM